MQGNSTNTKFGSTKSKQRFKRDRKINPKEIMNCWTAGTTSGPALVSRSLKMCPADAHTTVFGHFSRPKEALNRYAEKICKYSMKKFNKGQSLCWNSNNWKKTALQDLILNMATSGCLQSMMDSDTLAKGVEKSARCDYFEKSLAVKCKKASVDFMLRTLIVVRFSNDPVPLSAVSTFWDCNKHSVCNTQHARLNVSWSGRRVGLMDFDKLRESDCKRFWLFTHLQFVSTVAVLIPVAPYKSLPISPALMQRRRFCIYIGTDDWFLAIRYIVIVSNCFIFWNLLSFLCAEGLF